MKQKPSRIRVWAVVVWLGVWQLASMLLNHNSILVLLASPAEVLLRVGKLSFLPEFWLSIGFSMLRITGGFLTALITGVVLAALAARFRRVEELLQPLVLTIRTVPVASFIILALILFSSRNLSLLISFLMVFPVFYTNTLAGIRAAAPELLEMARVFELPALRTVRYIYLPQVLPFFRSGCEVALGLCWKSGVAAEVIGIPKGSIGEHLQQAKIYLDIPGLFAWTLVIVLLSLAFEKLFLRLLTVFARKMGSM